MKPDWMLDNEIEAERIRLRIEENRPEVKPKTRRDKVREVIICAIFGLFCGLVFGLAAIESGAL